MHHTDWLCSSLAASQTANIEFRENHYPVVSLCTVVFSLQSSVVDRSQRCQNSSYIVSFTNDTKTMTFTCQSMAPLQYYSCFFSVLLLLLSTTPPAEAAEGTVLEENSSSSNSNSQDLSALLAFKSSSDPRNVALRDWVGSDPCSGPWEGIRCVGGRVASVVFDGAGLVGPVDALLQLSQLEVLSLRRNALQGPLPALTNFTNPNLKFLLLSHNLMTGALNLSLPSLVSLRLEGNRFSGGLDGLHVQGVADLNLSSNQLSGRIPTVFSNFSSTAFGRNAGLCGPPLPTSCDDIRNSSNAKVDNIASTRGSPAEHPPPPPPVPTTSPSSSSKLGATAVLAVGTGEVIAVLAILFVIAGIYLHFIKTHVMISRHTRSPHDSTEASARAVDLDYDVAGRQRDLEADEKVYTVDSTDYGKLAELVCFQGGEELKLDSLLKASAEVLGKGTAGCTYRAVLDTGLVVAVKRLDARRFPCGAGADHSFQRHMRVVGGLRDDRVVSLRAYHSSCDEKLLVYDYMSNGSLQSLLGNQDGRNAGKKVLDWRRRKQILMDVAQGLSCIHSFPSRRPLVHGNIKPSNILIDDQGSACIAEWGIMNLTPTSTIQQGVHNVPPVPPYPSHLQLRSTEGTAAAADGCQLRTTIPTCRGYRAPELAEAGSKATQASDVYSLGMVVLEVATDKEIDDEEWEEEVMEIVKVGLMCTSERPEERPKMSQVVRMISNVM